MQIKNNINNKINIAVIMDPLRDIHPEKDTTLGLLFTAQQRGHALYFMHKQDLYLDQGAVWGRLSPIHLPGENQLPVLSSPQMLPLSTCQLVLLRLNPPFDEDYLYVSYLLSLAQKAGTLIVNNPDSVRDANEKLFPLLFADCIVPTWVGANKALLKKFLIKEQKIVIKPLNRMGGEGIFLLTEHDPNHNTAIDLLTQGGRTPILAQRFIPESVLGDKRILMINGKPYPKALLRQAPAGDFRSNLAQGGTGIGCELTERDQWLCERVGPVLLEKGLLFVGLDIIGDYITEINVTSPTCAREIAGCFKQDVCGDILEALLTKIR